MDETIYGAEDLREVRLYGQLGKRFGRVHKVAVRTCREATQALAAILDGFGPYMARAGVPGYYVFAGDKTVANNRGETLLDAPLGRGETVFVVPVVQGAKRGGVLQFVVGAVLVIAGAWFGQGWAVQLGVSLMLGGVTQMLVKSRKAPNQSPENLPSYHFDGPINSTQQGVPVPVVFGEMIVGSVVVSQGIRSSELAT